ncbi:Serine threonine-protein [Mycena kentingensis (nom. inval.)]|nr:Serine threonine-protein [Mycena kentingensis (nom. inval.)]
MRLQNRIQPRPEHPIGNPDALYVHLLQTCKRGYPLCEPGLRFQQREKNDHGVCVGDVGYIHDDGAFIFLLNIFHPDDDVHSEMTSYQPLDRQEMLSADHPPGSYVANGVVETHPRFTPELDEGISALSFRSTSEFGAICALPRGSTVTKLADLSCIREHISRNATKWYRHLRDFAYRSNGSLYVITGVEKSDAWATLTLEQRFREGCCAHLISGEDEEGFDCVWQHGSAVTRWHYSTGVVPPVVSNVLSQTMFLHGFHIGLGAKRWNQFPRSAYGRWHNTTRVARLFSRLPPWLVSWIWSWPRWFANEYFSFYPLSYFHPSRLAFEYLSAKAPEAEVIITHDDEWSSVLNDTDTERPDPAEMLTRIQRKFRIVNENGTVYLAPRTRRWYQFW